MSDWRVMELQGIHNFRDYGGYGVADGRRIKRGLLWRSGQHAGATDPDLERVDGVGLATVFDLRTARERELFACRRPEKFSAQIRYSANPEQPKSAPHVEAARQSGGSTAEDVKAMMRDLYAGIAFRSELVAMTRGLAQELIAQTGPTLVNCMAGKDRTGMAVAAIHLAVGVSQEDVMADYLLTNTAGDPEARIQAGIHSVMGMGDGIGEDAARAIMGVEPEYLAAALDAINERHGSVDCYLTDVLGLDDRARERLKDAITEG